MKLKDFVAETLKEIVDGVIEAQKHYASKGGSVSPKMAATGNNNFFEYGSGQPAQHVEFDVAVTTSEGTESKGGIGVFVGHVGLGAQGKSDASTSSSSRIKFSVPVFLPFGERNLQEEIQPDSQEQSTHW